MSSFFAILHHIAAFLLVSALVVEFTLLRESISLTVARKIQIADALFGLSAGVVLLIGLSRVFYFEKGAMFYFANFFFWLKLALFIAIGLLSIPPTREFLSWRNLIRNGHRPTIDQPRLARLKKLVQYELIAVGLLIACAALMARGVGMIPALL